MIVVDVETTGTQPWKHGIISIGAVNFKYPELYFYGECKPLSNDVIEKAALQINGATEEELKQRPTEPIVLMNDFYKWLREQPKDTPLIMGGHNVGFDFWFIQAEHDRLSLKQSLNPFRYRTIDLHSIAHTHYVLKKGFMYPKDMPANYIQQKLGIPVEPMPHNALNGAVWEAECFSRLLFNQSLFDNFQEYPVKENPWV